MCGAYFVHNRARRGRNDQDDFSDCSTAQAQEEKLTFEQEVTSLGSTFLPCLAPALGAGLLVACSRTLWSYATIAEVYTLNTFLIVVVLWLLLKWRRRIVEDEKWKLQGVRLVFLPMTGSCMWRRQCLDLRSVFTTSRSL